MAAPFLEAARYRACASRRACAGSARGLRRFGGFATFSYWRSHPSSARRGVCMDAAKRFLWPFPSSLPVEDSMKDILVGLLVCILMCAVAWAQSTAQISGIVKDQSGAIL